jgi:hypothetical protein
MATTQYPLQVPDDLLSEVRTAAEEAGVSMADVMRQSMKIGLPKLREQFRAGRSLKPFSKAEAAAAFGPDPEWDKLEMALGSRAKPAPEAD